MRLEKKGANVDSVECVRSSCPALGMLACEANPQAISQLTRARHIKAVPFSCLHQRPGDSLKALWMEESLKL